MTNGRSDQSSMCSIVFRDPWHILWRLYNCIRRKKIWPGWNEKRILLEEILTTFFSHSPEFHNFFQLYCKELIMTTFFLVIPFNFDHLTRPQTRAHKVQLHTLNFLSTFSRNSLSICSSLLSTLTLTNLQLQLHNSPFTAANYYILQLQKLWSKNDDLDYLIFCPV